MSHHKITPDQIDAILPQTQCKDCGYNGCRPYAEAIIYNNETIDRCLPGGIETLKKLGNLLAKDVTPYISHMEQKSKPKRLAVIREDECIGCTKCIQACPVDAIMGASKQMHTVINAECTGCELCVEPCPMDCIDLIVTADQTYQAEHAKQRYYTRLERLAAENSHAQTKQIIKNNLSVSVADKKVEIAAAIARAKAKKK